MSTTVVKFIDKPDLSKEEKKGKKTVGELIPLELEKLTNTVREMEKDFGPLISLSPVTKGWYETTETSKYLAVFRK